jgi:D-threo-aldose 1-dehydrogenase
VKFRTIRGVPVSELGFGGAVVGNLYTEISDEAAAGAIEAAWAGGVRYFDTAPHYGLGLSERRLGAALSKHPRDEFAVSTKVGRLLEPNPAPTGSDMAAGNFAVPDTLIRRFDFSRDGVRRSLDASLQRLGLDRVDIVFVHDPDDHVDQAVADAIPALVELRDQGVIGAVGVGMNQWQAPLRMIRETDLDVVMLAGRWTLLDRTGAELVAECADRHVAVVDAAPFNSGLLATDHPSTGATFNYAPAAAEVLARADELAGICARAGVHLPAAAVQFPLRLPQVASVVCGVRTAAEAQAAVDRYTETVPDAVWEAIDA